MRGRARRWWAGLGLVACTSGLVAATGDAGAVDRALTLDPGTITETQAVKVSWSGFRPYEPATGLFTVTVVQCKANPQSLADCIMAKQFPDSEDGNRVVGVRTAADGTGSAYIEVRSQYDPIGLECSSTVPCTIVAYETDGTGVPAGRLPATATVTEIKFAHSFRDCPPVTDFDVTLSGEASAAGLVRQWAGQRCGGADPLVIDYTTTSSNLGRDSFLTGEVDMGVTSLPATAEELAEHTNVSDFAYAPIDLTAVAVVYNMVDPVTGQRIDDLKLTPRLVARVISDTELSDFFRDPELLALNPGVTWPRSVLAQPLVRAERHADARLVTGWIDADADARAFLDGADRFGVAVNPAWEKVEYPADLFEPRAGSGGYLPRQGAEDVTRRVFAGATPSGTVPVRPDTVGLIGVADLTFAQRYALPVAAIRNAAGQFVRPTEDTILAGAGAMRGNTDGTHVSSEVGAAAVPGAYPLVKADFAMVTLAPPKEARDSFAKFLRYAAGDGQRDLPVGYVALPDSLASATRAIADRLDGGLPPTTPPDGPGGGFGPDGFGGGFSSSASAASARSGAAGGANGSAAGGEAAGEGVGSARYAPVASLTSAPERLAVPAVLALGAVGAGAWAVMTWRARRRARPSAPVTAAVAESP